jgi:uncharacterized protein (DUF58 family)
MKDVLKEVKKLDIITRDLVSGIVSGNYHSVFKGQGLEFCEIREYLAGDDVRSIDWNVTARMNRPYVKEFIEERDLRVYFLMDFSGSFNFGDEVSKNEKSALLVASLMFSAVKNNDSVGVFFGSNELEKFVKARKGKKHAMRILKDILTFEAEKRETDLNGVIREIYSILKRKSLVFIVSDFVSPDFSKALNVLRGKHDVVAIKISDNKERDLGDVGLIELEDEETGEQILVNTSDKEFRDEYARIIREHDEKIKDVMKKCKVDMIEVFTDGDFKNSLNSFFRKRKMRMVR